MFRTGFGLLLLLSGLSGFAQSPAAVSDAEIRRMASEVSAQNLEAIVRKLVSFETRHTLSDTLSSKTGIGAARNWIKQELEKYSKEGGGRLKVEFDTFVQAADGRRILKDVSMKNVLAILPGIDPEDNRIFIVTGHYDSRATDVMDAKSFAPGANDDGSGTAAVMEMARVMSKYKFNATIIFGTLVAEEQGLYGAAHLAKRAKESGWNVEGMITNDIVGNTYGRETDLRDSRSVRIFSEGVPPGETKAEGTLRSSIGSENDGGAREFARYLKESGEKYVDQLDVKLIYRKDRYLRGGDHTAFSEQGFNAIRVTEMNEDFNRQHQNVRTEKGVDYGDFPEFVDYTYLRKVARMNLVALASLSLAPQKPQNVTVLTRELTNRTSLQWDVPKGEKPAGYYVTMRETSSPFWEKKIFVTDPKITLDYSKDNYFFGVQAVDAEGHESLVVIPKPGR